MGNNQYFVSVLQNETNYKKDKCLFNLVLGYYNFPFFCQSIIVVEHQK